MWCTGNWNIGRISEQNHYILESEKLAADKSSNLFSTVFYTKQITIYRKVYSLVNTTHRTDKWLKKMKKVV